MLIEIHFKIMRKVDFNYLKIYLIQIQTLLLSGINYIYVKDKHFEKT